MKRTLLKLAVLALAASALQVQAADLLASTKSRGVLRIAMEGTYPPFNFKDPKTGELSGYDVDVAKLLSARLGLKPEFVTTEWSAILAGLSAGKYDVIISQVGISPSRLQAFDFTTPYTYSMPQLIVRKNETATYTTLDQLRGKKVGVGQGSVFEQQAKLVPGLIVKSYPAAPENLQDLAFGRVDVALNDSLIVPYLLKNSNLPIKPGAMVGTPQQTGIPFQKNNPQFKAAIGKALADITADGSLSKAAVKWFGYDASKPPR